MFMVPILLALFETKVKKKKFNVSLIYPEAFIKHLLCAKFWSRFCGVRNKMGVIYFQKK